MDEQKGKPPVIRHSTFSKKELPRIKKAWATFNKGVLSNMTKRKWKSWDSATLDNVEAAYMQADMAFKLAKSKMHDKHDKDRKLQELLQSAAYCLMVCWYHSLPEVERNKINDLW